MTYRVQLRADAEIAKRFGFRVSGPVQWVTVTAKRNEAVAERIAQGYRVDHPNSIVRIVRARS
jgi:hypothetical protein